MYTDVQYARILAHVCAHLLHHDDNHTHGLINQQTKKLVSLLAVSLARLGKARSEYRIYYVRDDDSDSSFS